MARAHTSLYSALLVAALVVALYFWVDRLAALAVLLLGSLVGLGILAKRFAPKSPFELKIEQDGKILIFLTIGLGFAALNTGSNLLYLILGILLSVIILSGILSQQVLMYIRVRRTFPKVVRAGVPVVYKTTVRNLKKWFPSYHLVVSVADKAVAEGAHTFVPLVNAADTTEVFNSITFQRRGVIALDDLNHEIATRFPFGFFTKRKRCGVAGSVLVLPGSVAVDKFPISLVGRLETQSKKKHDDDEFFGLRPFEEGDDFKRIEWKRSTVGDEFIVKQTRSEQGEDLHLWMYRSKEQCAFSPSEEFWISVVATVVESAHQQQRKVFLHVGEHVQVLATNTPTPEPIWRELALLDTLDLPETVRDARADDLLIDVSSPLPERVGDQS